MKKFVLSLLFLTVFGVTIKIGTSAALPVFDSVKAYQKTYDADNGDSLGVAFSNFSTVSQGATLGLIQDGENTVVEFYLGGGAYESTRRYAIIGGSTGSFDLSLAREFCLTFDLKLVVNTAGFYVEVDDAVVVLYPKVFTEGEWYTVKVEKVDDEKTFYIKERDADDSTYRTLCAGTDYCSTQSSVGSSWAYFSLDTGCMGLRKDANKQITQAVNPEYDFEVLNDARVYLDNVYVHNLVRKNSKNVILTYNPEIMVETRTAGADKRLDFGISKDFKNLTTYFDAVRTGGNAPISVLLSGKVCAQGLNIVEQPNDCTYTYKADWYLPDGSSYFQCNGVYRKEKNSHKWEALTENTDYILGYVYNRTHHNIIVGYLGSDHYLYQPAYVYSQGDENTVWKISNIQFVMDKAGVTGEAVQSGDELLVNLNVSAGIESSTPIVAIYDSGRLRDVNFKAVSHTGQLQLPLLNAEDDMSLKLFYWDSFENSEPLMEETDITHWIVEETETQEETYGLLNAPLEKEYAGEFTVDWSDPKSYADWTITPSPDIIINEHTGILSFDINGKEGYYQVERAPLMPDNFDVEFSLCLENYGSKDFMFKATHPGMNNYQYFREDRIAMTNGEYGSTGGMGLFANIGNEWHDWKFEVRGEFVTIYLDGGELYRFRQVTSRGQKSLIRFVLQATPNDEYKIHLGSIHYKPYFESMSLTSPQNGAEFAEGSDITFRAEPESAVEYVDFFVNGLNVGRGYAPDYEYVLKNIKQGTYRVSAGIGSSSPVESVITVGNGFGARVIAERGTISYGEDVLVHIETRLLSENAGVKPVAVEYFVDGQSVGVSNESPFSYTFENLKVGTTGIYAVVSNGNGGKYTTNECLINVTSVGNETVELIREYEINYGFSGKIGSLNVTDGYFELYVKHQSGKMIFKSDKGTEEVSLGEGDYKIVTTSGVADVYYNGQFAISWNMPRSSISGKIVHSGLNDFEIGGTGVKHQLYSSKWQKTADFSEKLPFVPRNYSIEFDKTDASDETIVFYDGEYEIKLEIKNGVMTAVNHDIETAEDKPFVLEGEAKAGYYRITVAKGLAQVWINNSYVDSFAAPASSGSPWLVRKMSNPSASTIIAVKTTDDKYFHKDDFSGNGEIESLEYWIEDSDAVTATIEDECLRIEGTGDCYLNSQSDDVLVKWSAKILDAGSFYIAPRVFRGPYYHIKAGYDFDAKEWFVEQWAKEAYYPVDKEYRFDGTELTRNVWHDFEMYLEDECMVLKMDGQTVISTDKIDMPFWGYTGFGVEGGTVLIDNLDYSGKCKTSAIKTAEITDDVGISEFYQLSSGRVIAECSWNTYIYSDNEGAAWSEAQPSHKIDLSNVITLNDGRLFRMAVEGNGNGVAYVSADNGKKWRRMGELNSCRAADRRVILNGTIIQSSTGRIHVACDETYTESKSKTGLYYSDDCGISWFEARTVMGFDTKNGIETDTTGFNFQEGSMTELPDGTIRYFARTGLGYLYYMDSADGGENFGDFRPSQFINPLCSFAIERDNVEPNTYYAAIEYDATTYSYRYIHAPRNRFALMVSYDGMETWEFVMTLNEWADFPLFDSCNHSMRVFGDTIFINWNNLHSPRRSFVYTVDKQNIRSTKRFEEIHERWFHGAMGSEAFDKMVMLPKTSGEGIIYGNIVNVDAKEGMYTSETIAQCFGAEYSVSDRGVDFRLGGAVVEFAENSPVYAVNGNAKNFTEICMTEGRLNIKACAEAFGKKISEDDDSYVLWYGEPLTEQYLEGYLACI